MDATGSYDASFYLSGSLMLMSAVICYPLNRINMWEKRKKKPTAEESSASWLKTQNCLTFYTPRACAHSRYICVVQCIIIYSERSNRKYYYSARLRVGKREMIDLVRVIDRMIGCVRSRSKITFALKKQNPIMRVGFYIKYITRKENASHCDLLVKG